MAQSNAILECKGMIPDNYKHAWDMLLKERERISQQQEDEFSRIVGIAHYCVERFRIKGSSQIRNGHEEKRKEAEEIFYTIQDLTNSLEDSYRQMREEERDPTPEESDQIASMEQQLHTQKSNLERTLPDIRSCLDAAELKNTLEESLPFEKEEINETLS